MFDGLLVHRIKLLMKQLLLCLFYSLVVSLSLSAQCGIGYSYDAGGNRIARTASCPNSIVHGPDPTSSPSIMLASQEIDDQEDRLELTETTIFPNPASEYFELRFSGTLPKNSQLTLLDATGRQVMRQTLNGQRYYLDKFPSGTYRLVLRTPTQQHSLSLIKAGQ